MTAANTSIRAWFSDHLLELITIGVLTIWCVIVSVW